MPTEGRRLLESWKEISAYLKKSERTCRRFEVTLGLPVHRLDGTPKAHVFAYVDEIDSWLQGKLNHTRDHADQPGRSQGLERAVLASCAVVLAVAAVLVWRPFSPSPVPLRPHNPSVAVLPFDNPTRDAGLERWRTALADLVVTDLRQSRYVNVVGITDLLRIIVGLKLGEAGPFSEEAVLAIAKKGEVDYVTTGTLAMEGPEIAVTIFVHGPGSPDKPRLLRTGYRAEADIFSAADDLAKKIKLALGLTSRHVRKDIDHDAADISTASPQAFELFSQGYRMAGLAKYAESIAVLQKAVDADPNFALAYKYLSLACQFTNRTEDEKAYIRKAFDLSRRLSDRERGELEVRYFRYHETDEVRELEALQRLVRTYPEDRFGSVNLLGYFLGREEWDKALPVALRAWSATRTDINICRQLALCWWNLGQPANAESVLSGFISSNPGHAYWRNAVRLRSQIETRLGRFDEALGDLDTICANYPNYDVSSLRGIVFLYQHDFEASEREFRRGLAGTEPSARIPALMFLRDLFLMRGRIEDATRQIRLAFEIVDGAGANSLGIAMDRTALHLDMAYLHRLAGRPAEALDEVEASLKSYEKSSQSPSPPLRRLHLKAQLFADQGRWEEYENLAEEIKRTIQSRRVPKMMRIHHHLLGYGELKKGNYEKAVAHFSRAVDLIYPSGNDEISGTDPEYLYSLAQAQALFEGGPGGPGAFGLYERIVDPAVNRLHNGDIYARSLYETARHFDVQARRSSLAADDIRSLKTKAIARYKEFLEVWGGADPLFTPLIEDAKTRLTALEGHLPLP